MSQAHNLLGDDFQIDKKPALMGTIWAAVTNFQTSYYFVLSWQPTSVLAVL